MLKAIGGEGRLDDEPIEEEDITLYIHNYSHAHIVLTVMDRVWHSR